ncbi:MAG: ADP-ribosyltransferase domain-containing protein [Plesiomonas sp.]
MTINSIGHKPTISFAAIQQNRARLFDSKSCLSRKIFDIKNTVIKKNKDITAHKNNITRNRTLLKSLQSVSGVHGESITVRLKDGRFKIGQASNVFKKIFNESRYQMEREAAIKKIDAKGSRVSAVQVMKTLQSRIDSDLNKVNELSKEVDGSNQKISIYGTKISSIEKQIAPLTKMVNDANKANEKNLKDRENFSAIYQSNAGCKALNVEARHQFGNVPIKGKVNGSEVVEEYRDRHGYEIFSRGNKELKSTIEINCSNLRELVKTGAEVLYTPTEKNITTHRGQGITLDGINKLYSTFKRDLENKTVTTYSLGQFFSTSTYKNVAQDFAERSQDKLKVIFQVKGNSGNGLSIPGGLSFENKEGEILYSPLATFKVTAVSQDESGIYHISLQEVSKADRAQILPY